MCCNPFHQIETAKMASVYWLALIVVGLTASSIQEDLGIGNEHLDTAMQKSREQDGKADMGGSNVPINPNYLIENNGIYFEGDLKISQELIDSYYGNSPSIQSLTPTGLWPNGEYHYICDESVDGTTKNLVNEAIDIWKSGLESCLDFIEGKSDLGYVKFTSNRHGCYSTAVGYQGAVEHLVSLENPECTNLHTVLHEIGHTIGYWHEQSRPDRDNYVRIDYSHVKREYRTQLNKQNPWGVSMNDMVYDYGSIMHYSQYAFSGDGQMTITIVNMTEYQHEGSPVLGQGTSLSATDVAAMKRHYMCT